MRVRRALLIPAVSALVFNAIALAPLAPSVALAGSTTRLISAAGTTVLRNTPTGSAAVQFPEIRGEPGGEMNLQSDKPGKADVTNRSQSARHAGLPSALAATPATSASIAGTPGVDTTFMGLNHRDQRTANGGNQFSLEPPDQGLCVGNGFVLETINDVMRVSNTSGTALLTEDLNTFYGYPAAFHRQAGPFGPFITDPSCYYDSDTGTWFHVVLTLDVVAATGAFTGTSHLDLAVRHAASPIGTWKIYQIDDENDGTNGQPDHGCSFGPCFGDYPHIGADANGFYISTNEYSFFGPEFKSANIYAFSKSALAATPASVAVQQMDTMNKDGANPGFTVWPAISPAAVYETGNGGTEYFLSSNAADEANGGGSSDRILIWALTNTSSLATATPALHLSNDSIDVASYSIPPKSDQKPGSIPLGDCLNDRTTKSALWKGAGCWRAFFLPKDQPKKEVMSHLDSHDTRMQQVSFANGKVWGALDTAVSLGSEVKAGITYYVVTPSVASDQVSGSLDHEATLGVAHNNVTYPALSVLPNGEGVMAFTLVGRDYYPSAAWAAVDASGIGDVHVISPGQGPSDSFTSYKAFVGNPPRTRWGDYGAAAVDGSSIWIASESIEQTCTFTEYVATAFSCNATRTSLGNWATRISKVTP
ncbi:MAG: hypothetical protein ABI578_07445 [Chloroflexota bacterium]